MPLVGLGTWEAAAEEVEAAVGAALAAGVRHIDCASSYRNEAAVSKSRGRGRGRGRGRAVVGHP